MTKIICDRCGKECEGKTYYTIDIYAKDIEPMNDGLISFTTAIQNSNTNLQKMFGRERCYCEKCKEEIEKFIYKDGDSK